MSDKFILMVQFKHGTVAHYVLPKQYDICFEDSLHSLDDVKEYLKSIHEIVLSPETLDDVLSLKSFSIHNDVEI